MRIEDDRDLLRDSNAFIGCVMITFSGIRTAEVGLDVNKRLMNKRRKVR